VVVTVMVEKRDRLTLSRDIELIADRIARSGQTGRADELKVVAAHLRAKEAAQADEGEKEAPRAYVLGIALLMSWLAVALLVVLLLG